MPLGRTDKHGAVAVQVGFEGASYRFAVRKPGFVVGYVEKGRSPDFGTKDKRYDGVDYHAHLIKAPDNRIRILVRKGQPLANHRLYVDVATGYKRRNSTTSSSTKLMLETDSKGEVAVPAPGPHDQAGAMTFPVPTNVMAELPWGRGMSRQVGVEVRKNKQAAVARPVKKKNFLQRLLGGKKAAEAGAKASGKVTELVISKLCPVEVRVRSHSGLPMDGAQVGIHMCVAGSSFQYTRVTADRQGRARLLLPPNSSLVVAASHRGQFGGMYVKVKPDPGQQTQELAKLQIRLNKGREVTGVVLNQAGKPAVGARVYAYSSYPRRGKLLREDLQLKPVAAPGYLVVAAKPDQTAQRAAFSMLDSGRDRSKTDKEGRFRLRVPVVEGVFRVHASCRVGKQWASGSTNLELESEADPVTGVEIELNR